MANQTAVASINPTATAVREGSTVAATVHTLKITLPVEPEVSRVVEVSSDITLDKLAETLVWAMGWQGDHSHIFIARRTGIQYCPPQDEWDGWDPGRVDETQHRLGDVLGRSRMKMSWEYDRGVGWHHEIVVVHITAADPDVTLPRCVAATGDCPPDT